MNAESKKILEENIPTYDYLLDIHGEEALKLCGINERYDNESLEVKIIRQQAVGLMYFLVKYRNATESREAGRNYSIAITALEDSCMRAVKGFYSE